MSGRVDAETYSVIPPGLRAPIKTTSKATAEYSAEASEAIRASWNCSDVGREKAATKERAKNTC